MLENPKKHFAYNMHIAKELAFELHKKNINCVTTNKKMSLRLEFYGIQKCEKFTLQKTSVSDLDSESVTVSYKNKILYQAYVTKINNK